MRTNLPLSNKTSHVNRRTLLKTMAATTIFSAVARAATLAPDVNPNERVAQNGNIKHSVSKWCYTGGDKMSFDELCTAAAKMGIQSIELLGPDELPTVKKHGLTCAIVSSHPINRGMNRIENHEFCVDRLRTAIDAAAEFGCPGTISFSGNREGLADEEGIKNAVIGFKQIVGYAEEKGVTINI